MRKIEEIERQLIQLKTLLVTERATRDGPALGLTQPLGNEILSPDWHQDIFADRKARAQREESKFSFRTN
jgi:hypothetical protein